MILVSLALVACDFSVQWADHPYEVHWIDITENRTLSRRIDGDGSATIGRVEAEVIAVGSDDKFVVAKRLEPETDNILYYYLEKSQDGKYLNLDEITQGPFSEKYYMQLKEELGLPGFTEEF